MLIPLGSKFQLLLLKFAHKIYPVAVHFGSPGGVQGPTSFLDRYSTLKGVPLELFGGPFGIHFSRVPLKNEQRFSSHFGDVFRDNNLLDFGGFAKNFGTCFGAFRILWIFADRHWDSSVTASQLGWYPYFSGFVHAFPGPWSWTSFFTICT